MRKKINSSETNIIPVSSHWLEKKLKSFRYETGREGKNKQSPRDGNTEATVLTSIIGVFGTYRKERKRKEKHK